MKGIIPAKSALHDSISPTVMVTQRAVMFNTGQRLTRKHIGTCSGEMEQERRAGTGQRAHHLITSE